MLKIPGKSFKTIGGSLILRRGFFLREKTLHLRYFPRQKTGEAR